MKAYKVYFDKNDIKFKCESTPSDVNNTEYDSTTHWVDTYEHACEHVKNYNENRLKEVIICKDCKTPFWMTESEKDWFAERQLDTPKRCYSCRRKRRQHLNK